MGIKIKKLACLVSILVLTVFFQASSMAAESGDVDASGTIDLSDVILSLRVISGYQDSLTIEDGVDIGNDGQITLQEAIANLVQVGENANLPKPTAIITIDDPDWYADTAYFPDLGMSSTRGYTGFPVFFQGWQSTPREDISNYSWDFGTGTESDEGGRYFQGLNGAHVYEQPGVYTVTLKVKNKQGQWSSTSATTVEVLSRESAQTHYVDSEIGDDSFDGLSMNVNGNSGPWKTATKAFEQMQRPSQHADLAAWPYQPGDRIVFKRGQVFEMSKNLTIGHGYGTQGYSFESYGDSLEPKPRIQYTGTSEEHMITFGYGSGYITFKDLEFNFLSSDGQSSGLIFATSALKNLLFLRCDFYEPNNGVFSFSGGYDGANVIANIFMVNSSIQNPTTCPTSTTQMYATGIHGFALVNNSFDKSGNHIGYFGYIDKGLVSGNVFSRPAFGRTALRITGGDFEHPGNNIHILNNKFLGWVDPFIGGSGRNGGAHGEATDRYNYLLVHLGPNTPSTNMYLMLKDIIFERNFISNAEGLMNICNAENIIVRNNIFITPDNFSLTLTISAPDPGPSRPSKDIFIQNNNFINIINQNKSYNSEVRSLITIYGYTGQDTGYGTNHTNINIKNNIFYIAEGRQDRIMNLSEASNALYSELHSDYNLIYRPSDPLSSWYKINAEQYDFDSWKQTTGSETNTIVTATNPFPGMASWNHTSGDPNSIDNNVAEANEMINFLQGILIHDGVDKGTNVDVFEDFSGISRPDQGIDIGAFER